MPKDRRYKAARKLIEAGEISAFGEIFEYVPKTVVTIDFGTNHATFRKRINNPDLFTIRELKTLAGFFEVDAFILIELAYNTSLNGRKIPRKSS